MTCHENLFLLKTKDLRHFFHAQKVTPAHFLHTVWWPADYLRVTKARN
jgi:hypothetical protein